MKNILLVALLLSMGFIIYFFVEEQLKEWFYHKRKIFSCQFYILLLAFGFHIDKNKIFRKEEILNNILI